MKFRLLSIATLAATIWIPFADAETLPSLNGEQAPQTFTEMWSGFDPRAEPLETEVLHEWEEDGVVMRVLRYRIGVFKGTKAMMAAVYGFPRGGTALPGLLNLHGGGQYADSNAVLTNAKRGYATIAIAWAGRLSAPDYRVSPREVKLFWEGRTGDPAYKITTDWGALDAYHAPSRHGQDAFVTLRDGSEPWTLDDVESPRNSSWFLSTLGARRALTFLEQRPEVDGNRLGVYGHSMGGKLTIATSAADSRVKAAAPSCGGISDRYNSNPLHGATVGDSSALKQVGCPTIFLSPANDFHGHINNLPEAVQELGDTEWRVTCSAHLNHRDYPQNEVATQLWFDQHLKEEFQWPETPRTELQLKTPTGIPALRVHPDGSHPIERVEVYYTQQGKAGKEHRVNRINQFWHNATCTREGDLWTAQLPLHLLEQPLWVYANVIYRLDEPISGAGYYYGNYTAETYNLSSLITLVSPEELRAAEVRPTLKPSTTIESFQGDWEREWYRYERDGWGLRTHKVYHPLWAAPEGAKLVVEVQSSQPNKLVLGLNDHAAEISLAGTGNWETFHFSPGDFRDFEGSPLPTWNELLEFRMLASERIRSTGRDNPASRLIGAEWKGAPPEFRSLRWE